MPPSCAGIKQLLPEGTVVQQHPAADLPLLGQGAGGAGPELAGVPLPGPVSGPEGESWLPPGPGWGAGGL